MERGNKIDVRSGPGVTTKCAYTRYNENDRYGETYTSNSQRRLNIKVAINFPLVKTLARARQLLFCFFFFFYVPGFFCITYSVQNDVYTEQKKKEEQNKSIILKKKLARCGISNGKEEIIARIILLKRKMCDNTKKMCVRE